MSEKTPTRTVSRKGLGFLIKMLRVGDNLTTSEVSEAAGISQAALSAIENGKVIPAFDTIVKLADVLDVDIGALTTAATVDFEVTDRRVFLLNALEKISGENRRA